MTSAPLEHRVDIAVVGAGFTGLSAASALREHGLTTVVLEARDRVGGKVESRVDGLGTRYDSGGQFVADEMHEVQRVIAEAGATLVRSNTGGRPLTVPAEWHDDWDAGETLYESARDEGDIDPDLRFHEWVTAARTSTGAKAAAVSTATGQMCLDHRLLGLAHVADQLRRTPPLAEELQYSVEGTLHAVAERMASSLDVRCSSPVRRVDRQDDGMVVDAGHLLVHARHVIVAVPPSVVTRIVFAPPLPPEVAAAADAFRAADVTKIRLRYPAPFWRDRGLDGTVRFCTPAGLYVADASVGAVAALVVFVGGPLAAEWRALGDQERRDRAIAAALDAFGPLAALPVDVQVRDWPPDEWGGGGYCQFVTGTGHPDQIPVLLAGAPGVTFAATELADRFPGYVDGALRAGRAAAQAAVIAAT